MDAGLYDLAGGDSFAPGPQTGGSIGGAIGAAVIPILPGILYTPGENTVGAASVIVNPGGSLSEEFQRKLYSIGLTAGTILLAFIIFAIGLYTIVSE